MHQAAANENIVMLRCYDATMLRCYNTTML